jgi:hypothetical protein
MEQRPPVNKNKKTRIAILLTGGYRSARLTRREGEAPPVTQSADQSARNGCVMDRELDWPLADTDDGEKTGARAEWLKSGKPASGANGAAG